MRLAPLYKQPIHSVLPASESHKKCYNMIYHTRFFFFPVPWHSYTNNQYIYIYIILFKFFPRKLRHKTTTNMTRSHITTGVSFLPGSPGTSQRHKNTTISHNNRFFKSLLYPVYTGIPSHTLATGGPRLNFFAKAQSLSDTTNII